MRSAEERLAVKLYAAIKSAKEELAKAESTGYSHHLALAREELEAAHEHALNVFGVEVAIEVKKRLAENPSARWRE